MIMRKETLVFLTSLAIIFIIGYVNMTMAPENEFDEKDYAQFEENAIENVGGIDLVEVIEQTDKTDITINPIVDAADLEPAVTEQTAEVPDEPTVVASEGDTDIVASQEEEAALLEDELDYVILGDITNILDDDSVVASSNGVIDMLNASFSNFKINKAKGNMDVIDHLEESLSNESISADTKSQFESLLLNKNEFVVVENDIELMLQSKGYNETVVIVDEDMVKVVSNDTIEQADATVILDVIVSETNYEPSQIKIVKFDNIDL